MTTPPTRSRPRALLITRNLPPLIGGMERLNWHLAKELARSFKVSICGPAGCMAHVPPGAVIDASFPSSPTGRFLVDSFVRCQMVARRTKPDLLIAGSGMTVPHIRLAGRALQSKTLVYLHGLDLVTRHPLYRALFLPLIRGCDAALVNSSNTARLARVHGVPAHRIHILNPGVALPSDLAQIDGAAFRSHLGIGARPVLLSVGRLTARKGLVEFVRQCLPEIVARYPDVLLLVVGGAANAQLGGGASSGRKAIEEEARRLGLANNLMFAGQVDDTTLAQAFRASNLHLFPVLDLPGDVEGFGMVAVEAAAHGLPTIGFSVGGVPDAIDDGRSGLLIPAGDYRSLAQAIMRLLSGASSGITAESCRAFAQSLSWSHFGERLRSLCGDLMGNTA